MSDFARLRGLTVKLETEPGKAAVPELPVLAYGYVRSDDRDIGYVKACAHLVEAWCTAAGWRLGVVFRDNGYDSASTTRPGFAGFLDAAAALVIAYTTYMLVKAWPEQTTWAVIFGCVYLGAAVSVGFSSKHGLQQDKKVREDSVTAEILTTAP